MLNLNDDDERREWKLFLRPKLEQLKQGIEIVTGILISFSFTFSHSHFFLSYSMIRALIQVSQTRHCLFFNSDNESKLS